MNIVNPEDCYDIEKKDIHSFENGVSIFSKYFNDNRFTLCKYMFPEYDFKGWKFNTTIQNTWNDKKNIRDFMDELGTIIGYTSLDDFYKLRQRDILDNDGSGMLVKKYDTCVFKCLLDIYPEKDWDKVKFLRWNSEKQCIQWVQTNFTEFEFEPIFYIDNCKIKRNCPFDVGSKKFRIIIEIDGCHHFRDIDHHKSKVFDKIQRDLFKMEKAFQEGYTIIRITDFDIYHRFNKVQQQLLEILSNFKNSNIKLYLVSSKLNIYQHHVKNVMNYTYIIIN
jgi:very-short-patch-repair endonuclease